MAHLNKVAILIDGGFFLPRFKNLHQRPPVVSDIQPFCGGLIQRVQDTSNPNEVDVLFRIFYYDCRPYGDVETSPNGQKIDFSQQPTFKAANQFQNDLRTFPQLALRLGGLSFNGWKIDPRNPQAPPKPDFKQKSVDMKIGLDIAWMASKHIVDKIVLVAGDSDFVSPMKFARREGLLVYLDTMGQKMVKLELKEHADFLL
jgi:uncharacterized LabA/DUF88 family protein